MKSLTRLELNNLLAAAKTESPRDYLMLLVTFNHGLRASETVNLSRANIVDGFLVVQRLKGSHKTTQPLLENERALESLPEGLFFPMSRRTFQRRMEYYGEKAGIPAFKRHPHALKHSTGRLGYEGGMGIPELQKYLGHKNGNNTMVYLQATEEQAANAFAAAVGR